MTDQFIADSGSLVYVENLRHTLRGKLRYNFRSRPQIWLTMSFIIATLVNGADFIVSCDRSYLTMLLKDSPFFITCLLVGRGLRNAARYVVDKDISYWQQGQQGTIIITYSTPISKITLCKGVQFKIIESGL
uniref:Uncharacterized protein n=1 Tax=Glossina palpalis gambiensis TaxID=67801 RepID=A0A1B0BP94_9MUSC